MVLLVLFVYFALENFLAWKSLCRDWQGHPNTRTESLYVKQVRRNSYILWGLSYLRDLLVLQGTRDARVDLVYSPTTQRIMMLQSVVMLCIAIGARFWAIKTIPIVELFYPVYRTIKEPTWKRDLLCPHYVGSMALFVTAFLWQPSTTGVYPLVMYPLLLASSSYYQQNCHEIDAALKRVFNPKDTIDKNV